VPRTTRPARPTRAARPARATRLAAVLAAGALALAACSGGEEPAATEPAASEPPSPSATAAPPVATMPLTGLPVADQAAAKRRHPPLVVKMDNTSSSAPQVGLDRADLLVEELVEGGLTRFAAFFYSDASGTVGPVRSMRASDIAIVKPVGADMVTSGAASPTVARIVAAGIRYFREGGPGFFRASDRVAPYNLMVDLGATAQAARQAPERPRSYLPFAKPGTRKKLPQGDRASAVTATFSSSHSTTWTYARGRYTTQDAHAAPGEGFQPKNVLLLRVPIGDAGYLDPAGNTVPETELTGSGEATLLHDGRVVRGTWRKAGPAAPLALRMASGRMQVPPGETYVGLVPADTGAVSVR